MRSLLVLLALVVAPALASSLAHADERILSFHSAITIDAGGGMDVVETLRVRAEQNQIRHGIYRDFPTDYQDIAGNRVKVEFAPLALTRDGVAEPFHAESQVNGIRVYFGAEETDLPRGEHTYSLSYRTARQLGFFDDHDELYWNVTGNGWAFPIDDASADIALPGDIAPSSIKVDGFTGVAGNTGRDFRASADGTSHARIVATRPLAPGEGLTVVASFPKGVVAAPSGARRAHWFLRDNGGVLVGLIALVAMWGYYLWQWFRVGRDPRAGVVVPQYAAPAGFTPGALRHIERMKYDDTCFAADVVDLAVHGVVTIEHDGGSYTLRRTGSGVDELSTPERSLVATLFAGKAELRLSSTEHMRVAAALKAHRLALDKAGIGRYFNTNGRLVIPAVLIGLVALVAGLAVRGMTPMFAVGGFLLLWLCGWSLGVIALVAQAVAAWRAPPSVAGYGGALALTMFALPFVAGEVFGIGAFARVTGAGFTLVAAALVLTNFAFFNWLRAPTVEGRRLLDQIAGLRLYLGVAERDDLARQQAPPMTTDEFQRFLPYALALGVEKTWADRFAQAVGPAAAAAVTSSMAWYRGSIGGSSLAGFASSIGSSLSGAISSSSSAPGSSSGGGGGGSSGGGGGGGGGGGW